MNEIQHIGFDIVDYRNQKVELDLMVGEDWPHSHELEIVHHYDENGLHFCPTGFVMCSECGAIEEEPEPYECNKWGEK